MKPQHYDPKTARCSKEQHDLISQVIEPVLDDLHNFIVGQKGPVTRTVLALLAVGQCDINPVTKQPFFGCGHILFVGPTGTGKTLLCKRLAILIEGESKRVQGTPDLMPSDITGFELLHLTSEEALKFKPGPIFANVLLVDEVNRIPPKAEAGLLQGMAEGIVTHADKTYVLPEPFFCVATMNPSEQGGTFQIAEALSDRFMFCDLMHETSDEQKIAIARRTEEMDKYDLKPITNIEMINTTRRFIFKNVEVQEEVLRYCARIIRSVNHPKEHGLFTEERKLLGGGTLFRQSPPLNDRTMIFLRGAAKAQAAIRYRDYVNYDDVRKIIPSVLRTRLGLITESAAYTLVSEEGDSLYKSRQDLINGLIGQILEGVPTL